MIKMKDFKSGLSDKELAEIAREIYCAECGHYGCPVAEGESFKEHKDSQLPCGDYRCCIN